VRPTAVKCAANAAKREWKHAEKADSELDKRVEPTAKAARGEWKCAEKEAEHKPAKFA
jgi:hypothetical protein